MNRNQKIIIGAGVILFTANYLINAYKKLRFGLRSWSVAHFSEQSVILKIVLFVTNPTFVTINIGNIDADILLENKVVGHIAYPINRQLKAHGTNTFSISVELLYTEALKEVWNILSDPTQPLLAEMNLYIKGTIDIGNRSTNLNVLLPIKDLIKQ